MRCANCFVTHRPSEPCPGRDPVRIIGPGIVLRWVSVRVEAGHYRYFLEVSREDGASVPVEISREDLEKVEILLFGMRG